MTASRPDNGRKPFVLLCAAAMLCTMPVYGMQEAEEGTEQTVKPAQGQADLPTNKAALKNQQPNGTKKPTTRSLYFLGQQPELQRQLGPAIGKPISIMPHPFVPKGSVRWAEIVP